MGIAGPRIRDGEVMFLFKTLDAKKVAVAGSFNQWDAERNLLSGPDENGVWSISFPLQYGRI